MDKLLLKCKEKEKDDKDDDHFKVGIESFLWSEHKTNIQQLVVRYLRISW